MSSIRRICIARPAHTAMGIVALVFLSVSALSFATDPPLRGPSRSATYTLNHQGVVSVNDLRFDGDGFFRFALVDPDSDNNVWTNDGTHVGESTRPDSAVSLHVVDGIYTVRLGDTTLPNMTTLSPAFFSDENLALRIWFNDGSTGIQRLAPDQPLSSTPYAFRAQSAAAADNGVPPGTIVAFGGATPPSGWLLCDGSEVSRAERESLWIAIGDAWGAGDGSSTFNLPDLRGRFLRGVDGGIGRDPDAATRTECKPGGNSGDQVGSAQEDMFQGHGHVMNHPWLTALSFTDPPIPGNEATIPGLAGGMAWYNDWMAATPRNDSSGGGGARYGHETRPKNAYVNYIIKY